MITQRKALARMEQDTRTFMRRIENIYRDKLAGMWQSTVKEIQAHIVTAYRQDFGKNTWDLVGAHSHGTLDRIDRQAADILNNFKAEATSFIKVSLNHIHEQERLRALWMIDETTPSSFRPAAPFRQTREAADNPRKAKASWEQAFSLWIDTYQNQLNTNLRMESLHEGDIHDAADEAEATRVDGHDPEYKFTTMFSSEAIREEADARRAIYDENEDVLEEEIWVTMEDRVVCPICADYDGKPLSEVQDDIPAHYNCRCYTRFVPKAWAKMLRSGDPDEREVAMKMEDAGLIPDSLAIRSPRTGDLIGRAIVSFEDWKTDRGMNIAGAAR